MEDNKLAYLTAVLSAIILTTTFASFAFIIGQINPMRWSSDARAGYVIIAIGLVLWIVPGLVSKQVNEDE